MIVALAMPPPSHIVCSPYRPPRCSSALTRVVMMRAPLAPNGWPTAMAPPLTLVRSRMPVCSLSTSLAQARATGANAVTASPRPTRYVLRSEAFLPCRGSGPVSSRKRRHRRERAPVGRVVAVARCLVSPDPHRRERPLTARWWLRLRPSQRPPRDRAVSLPEHPSQEPPTPPAVHRRTDDRRRRA